MKFKCSKENALSLSDWLSCMNGKANALVFFLIKYVSYCPNIQIAAQKNKFAVLLWVKEVYLSNTGNVKSFHRAPEIYL